MATLTHIADRRLAIDELDKSIVNLSARINASTYELLVLIREFDESPAGTGAAGWLKWGLENRTQWLHWRCGLSRSAAREKVRVAHALEALPEISAAFARPRPQTQSPRRASKGKHDPPQHRRPHFTLEPPTSSDRSCNNLYLT